VKLSVNNVLDRLRVCEENGKKQILICKNKDEILEELDRFAINKAKLFPEIDDVADYLKNHLE